MNILVCVKQVPGSTKVAVDPVTGVLLRDGKNSKMNPYDLYAIEAALRIKEKHGASVSVISMGPNHAKEVVYEALYMGADEGAFISDKAFAGSDVLATSYTLAQGIKQMGSFDLIICGKQTTDGDTAQVGPETAEFLGIPSISTVQKIVAITKTEVTVKTEVSNNTAIIQVTLPCLITVEKDIFQPRLPSYRLKQKNAGKEIAVFTLQDMEDQEASHYGLNGSPTQVVRIFPPDIRSESELWKGSASKLAEKAYHKLKELRFR